MCSLEFPDLESQIWQKYADRGVKVLGLSGAGLFGNESLETVRAFRDQTGATFPLLLGDRTVRDYATPDGSISPYPVDVILDRAGNIRYLRHEFDGAAMEAMIERLLDE